MGLGLLILLNGYILAYGGTDSHFCMLDLNSVDGGTGFPLRGEPAVRLLDMAGIVPGRFTAGRRIHREDQSPGVAGRLAYR